MPAVSKKSKSTAKASNWRSELDRAIDALFERQVEIRRHLHQHPEVSGYETKTTRFLRKQFPKSEFRLQSGPDHRGLIVEPAAQPAGALIGMRADIDALPIQDTKTVEYCSRTSGVMHACGHDAHAATLVGAIHGLNTLQQENHLPWPISWRAIFQPAEETSMGAREMIDADALHNVQALLSMHMDPARPVGKVGYRIGTLTANCLEMEIVIHGQGGHASRPHESLDPIATGAQLISSIYLFCPRAVDTRDPVVVTIGQVVGGRNPNVIPDELTLRGTVRCLGNHELQKTMNHIRQLARGLEEISGTKISVSFGEGPPSVENDRDLTKLIRACATDVLGADNVQNIRRASMGGEDFAHYLKHVPGSMFRLGCAISGREPVALHAQNFDIDEQAMNIGAKILARAVVVWSDLSTDE
jgi:amidohydrolase